MITTGFHSQQGQPPAGGAARRAWFAPLNPPQQAWRGRTVWLVGASTGIGRATAALLHSLGARVIVSARKREALDQFTREHPGAMALPLDVCDAQAVREVARTLFAEGPPDCVVYCAGHYQALRATDFNLDEMLQHERVNYVGALHVLDAVLPPMLAARAGHLCLVGSVAGYRGLPNGLAYGPTKAALANLADTLYLDLRDHGIGVSLVSPGFVDTPLTAQNRFRMPALLTPEQAAQEIVRGWAQGRFEIHFPRRFTGWMKLLQWLPHRLYFNAVRRVTGL